MFISHIFLDVTNLPFRMKFSSSIPLELSWWHKLFEFNFIWHSFIFPLSVVIILLGLVVWAGICGFLKLIEHQFSPFCPPDLCGKSSVAVMGLPLFKTWPLTVAAFNTFLLFSVNLVFWLICVMRNFFTRSHLLVYCVFSLVSLESSLLLDLGCFLLWF